LIESLAKDPGIRPEDVMVVINTNNIDEWSFSADMPVVDIPS
jgi:hypothetical protein